VAPSPEAVLNGEAQTVSWKPVGGAESYAVVVDTFSGEPNRWSSDRGETYIFTGVIGSSYSFKFTGAQRGRWRVWAVDQNGQAGVPSEWREFAVER
jgi:hypothetical protein